jgi:DNA-binding winged helix-turn-helix (wHTH) protein
MKAEPNPVRARFDRFDLDEANARLTCDGEPVSLPPKPFAVLCALARTPRALVTKDALLDAVWGHRFLTESVLKSAIAKLRAALQDDAKQPRYIETVSRRGYRFNIASPSALAADAPKPQARANEPAASPALMIGRAPALERLRAAWQAARTGSRQMVWVAGEPGVGKTALIERLMAEAGADHCAAGQCVELQGGGEPYLPVLEALTTLCRRDPELVGLVRAVAPSWLMQLPWLSDGAERESLQRQLSGAWQARMLREMGELLDRYTQDRPLLLVTEDLQWSDPATVALMDHIARRRGSARLLWVASFRLGEVLAGEHTLRSLRRELRLHGHCDEIRIEPFTEAEVSEYVASRFPSGAIDDGLVHALHCRTHGWPLFVAHLVNDLAARGEPLFADRSSVLERIGAAAIPESIAGIVDGYVRQLTPSERALLEAASVCGTDFRLADVARLLQSDVESLGGTCMDIARKQRWICEKTSPQQLALQDAKYAFRHALYREVLYTRMAPGARVKLQRKAVAPTERRTARSVNEARASA